MTVPLYRLVWQGKNKRKTWGNVHEVDGTKIFLHAPATFVKVYSSKNASPDQLGLCGCLNTPIVEHCKREGVKELHFLDRATNVVYRAPLEEALADSFEDAFSGDPQYYTPLHKLNKTTLDYDNPFPVSVVILGD